MKRLLYLTLTLWPGVFVFFSGCEKIGEEAKAGGPVVEYPLALYDDSTTLTMHEGSKLSWVLRTRRLVKHNRSDRIDAKPVDLRVFDSTKAQIVRVTSDSGTVDEAVTFLAATGHVHGRSQKGLDITADSLRWNKAENRVSTESRVKVISEEGDTLRGRGFVSDANLDNWQILADVQGVFQKVEERVEKAEQDSSGPAPADSTPVAASPEPANPENAAKPDSIAAHVAQPPPADSSGKGSGVKP